MKRILKNNIINILCLLYYESLFGIMVFDIYNRNTMISVLIYIIFSSFVITVLTSCFSQKVNKIINYIIYFILSFYFSLHYVFKNSMQTFFSLSALKLTDQALGFAKEFFAIIFKNLYAIILFFIPFIIFIVFRKKLDYKIKGSKKYLFSYIVLIPLFFFGYRVFLTTTKDESLGLYNLYYNIDNPPLAVGKLGILSSTGVDIYRTIFGFESKVIITNYEKPAEEEDKPIVYDKNILDIELDENIDSNIKAYIENNIGTYKNEYTSMFEGKNLVFVVAESYSEIAISQELTPTLYKLTHNGFVFNNFYVPYYLSTIGGEFQAVTGLYPDMSILSNWKSGNNTFTYGLANVFRNKGYNTFAYHDHSGYFQDRYKYIKSLGFDNFKACYMGLDIYCDSWPESDIEMIDKTYTDYIDSDKPFLAYYMTVSGHFEYNYYDNAMSLKNKDLVYNLPHSDSANAYLATQIELDRALESLINKLDEKGKLDDTVIVMLADHYPYGLDFDQINELSSYYRDSLFEVNHNSLILWNNKMETVNIDKYGMPIDVIPTVYNLFGIDYDSRLFAGNDLLSNSDGLVMLNNRSWITDKGKYNTTDNTFSGEYDEEYINNINNIIQNRISFSKNMIMYDGYSYIHEKQ